MKKFVFGLLLFSFCLTVNAKIIGPTAIAAQDGTATLTVMYNNDPLRSDDKKIVSYVVTWTTNASGTATVTIPYWIEGRVAMVGFLPLSPAPTTLYDETILNDEGFDILSTKGTDRSATLPQAIAPHLGDGTSITQQPRSNGYLKIRVTTGGANKTGLTKITVEH